MLPGLIIVPVSALPPAPLSPDVDAGLAARLKQTGSIARSLSLLPLLLPRCPRTTRSGLRFEGQVTAGCVARVTWVRGNGRTLMHAGIERNQRTVRRPRLASPGHGRAVCEQQGRIWPSASARRAYPPSWNIAEHLFSDRRQTHPSCTHTSATCHPADGIQLRLATFNILTL